MAEYKDSYFGYSWDREQYSKPYHDEDFLIDIYTDDDAPPQSEIAAALGTTQATISRNIPEDVSRGGPGLPYEDVALFSGGYDSLVATHYTMEQLDGDAVLHVDTGTAIQENTEYVKHVCEWFGWPLHIVTPTKTLKEFAIEYGFPKSAAHSWIYRYLKEHPISSFAAEIEITQPHFFTGVRKDESQRRMETVTVEASESSNGQWVWESPIAEWTDEDAAQYMAQHGLPRSSVVETIGRSGECYCGAYADRITETEVLREHYPDHYEWISDLERDVQAEIGTDEDYCYWGTVTGEEEQRCSLGEHDDDVDMIACADCEKGGHRQMGHEQDPTYETIYVAGPRCGQAIPSGSVDEPDGVAGPNDPPHDSYPYYEDVSAYDPMIEWINPYALNEYQNEQQARGHAENVYQTDLQAIRKADAVLLHRISDYNLCGATVEATVAAREHDTPVIAHNDGHDEIPLMLQPIVDGVYSDLKAATQAVVTAARRDYEPSELFVI